MNTFKFSLSLCATLGALGLAGCGANSIDTTEAPITTNTPTAAMTPAAKSMDAKTKPAAPLKNARDLKPDTKNYRVRGVVKGIEKSAADGKMMLTVSHENILGFMQAMEMRLPLAQNGDADKIKVEDKIAFDLNRTSLEVSKIEVLPPATALKLKQ